MGMILFLFLAAILVGLVIWLYNNLVRLRVRSREAWADIETQLKRRWDLLPNLVETVKGYASHEKATLEKVVQLRSEAMHSPGPKEQGRREGMLTEALKSLFALAENYPDLKANTNFLDLQGTLGDIENQIQLSRRYYNAVVRDLNTAIHVFPSNMIAAMFGFKPAEFFELASPEEAQAPKISFSS